MFQRVFLTSPCWLRHLFSLLFSLVALPELILFHEDLSPGPCTCAARACIPFIEKREAGEEPFCFCCLLFVLLPALLKPIFKTVCIQGTVSLYGDGFCPNIVCVNRWTICVYTCNL